MMDAAEICDFFTTVAVADRQRWDEQSMHKLAKLQVPDRILGSRKLLLRADITLSQARWYLESLVDLAVYEHDDNRHIGHLANEIRGALVDDGIRLPKDELNRVAGVLAQLAWRDVQERHARRRARANSATKRELWFAAEPEPRCYLCGYRFTSVARDRFLCRLNSEVPLPKLVDFTRPRGLKARHLRIEIDHVRPVVAGGANELDNLRLACGWCNQVKGCFGSLYDVASWTIRNISHPTLGWVTVPQPFWLLRIVSMRGRCEHLNGCSARLGTHELFAAPARKRGTLNPVNVRVFCHVHDPWATDRLVSPALLGTAS